MSADYLVCAGDESQDMYILTSGSAQELKKNRVLRVLHAGDSFGEMLCFGFQFRCQVWYHSQLINAVASSTLPLVRCLPLARDRVTAAHRLTSTQTSVQCLEACELYVMSREDVLRIFKGSPERYEHLKQRVLELEKTPKPVISSAELLKAQENLNKRIRNSQTKQLASRAKWLKAKQLLVCHI